MYSKMPTKPKISIFLRFGLPTISFKARMNRLGHICATPHQHIPAGANCLHEVVLIKTENQFWVEKLNF